ncbi:TolB family protein, partial [Pseudomonas lurida]|uniref:TolB family protein n=1 Tax=Pseudomonas lurida TaxID=244566 RepID=UPI0030D94560
NWWVAELAAVDLSSGQLRRIAKPERQLNFPRSAPDGKSVAYVLTDRELHLVTLGAGGTDRTLFTGAIATDGREGPRPTWSPDGQYVAFPLRDARSFVNVHVVPAAGGAARPVSFLGNGEMGGIAWSPDGTRIVVGGGVDDVVHVFEKGASGTFASVGKPIALGHIKT